MSATDNSRVSASVKQRLLNLANQRHENFNLLLTRYALERFLYRLSRSSHRADLVLKGAMLFQTWSETPHRATRDMDFLARGDTDAAAIEMKIWDICSPSDDGVDGLEFNVRNLVITEIREDDHYGGLRAKFSAKLGSARIPVQLDFGVGDAVTPGPIETDYPTLLAMPEPRVLAYPRETVVAEKLEALVDLGMDNSRMKDFFDLWFILTTFDDAPESLATAVKATFTRRVRDIPEGVPIGLSPEFAADPTKLNQWRAFITRAVHEGPDLSEVIETLHGAVMPIFQAARRV